MLCATIVKKSYLELFQDAANVNLFSIVTKSVFKMIIIGILSAKNLPPTSLLNIARLKADLDSKNKNRKYNWLGSQEQVNKSSQLILLLVKKQRLLHQLNNYLQSLF